MTKRLATLFDLIENNKDCAVFTIKPEASPLDLVLLGGFEGHECMFRVSKDPATICITVFRDGDEPYHMNYGSSTTIVGEARRKVRDLIMECVNLDYGIVTGGRSTRAKSSFNRLVEDTSGPRDLNSVREFELIRTPSGDCSLFVNGQHVTHVHINDLDQWLMEKNILMVKDYFEEPSGNGCTIIRGEFKRPETLCQESKEDFTPVELSENTGDFAATLDKCFDEFLGKTGWQGLDAPSIVAEFVRFAKQHVEPSLDDLMSKAKENSNVHNASRPSRNHRPDRER